VWPQLLRRADNQVSKDFSMSLEERFSNALHASARAWRSALDRRLRGSGLSQAGWSAVAAAAHAAQPPSQTELAQLLGVEGATMVTTIDRLVRAGMVERVPSPRDRRVNLVVVTERGQALAEQVQRESAALRTELLAGIDGAQLAGAAAVLERLQHSLEAGP
jgi:MarR family transcriptional regulator for hemolysin